MQHFNKKPFHLVTALFKSKLVEGIQNSRMREESSDRRVVVPSCIPKVSDEEIPVTL